MLIDSWKVAVAGPSLKEEIINIGDPKRCVQEAQLTCFDDELLFSYLFD